MELKSRDIHIDVMRALGLLLIFLSHSAPSVDAVMQFRCFDVPMMVFISGLTFSNKSNDNFNYWTYIKKRTVRLICPVWLFLAAYISVLAIAQYFKLIPEYLTLNMAIESFLLYDGIGYVWIFRVFLLMMICAPVFSKIVRLSNGVSALCLVTFLLLLEGLFFVSTYVANSSLLSFVINEFLMYALGYAVLFILGMKLRNAKGKEQLYWILFVIVLSVIYLTSYLVQMGLPVQITPNYKFPPRGYFLVYGMLISTIVWITRGYWGRIINQKFLIFLGQNTSWIYLWHIPFVLVCSLIDIWICRYLVLLVMPLAIYSIQYLLVKRMNLPKSLKQILIG